MILASCHYHTVVLQFVSNLINLAYDDILLILDKYDNYIACQI